MLSPIAADHAYNPRNQGPLEHFTHFGEVGIPGEGAFVSIWLAVEQGMIRQAAYRTHGCSWSIACASILVQMVTGRTIEQAHMVEPKDIDLILGGLPEGKGEFAAHSVEALKLALR